MGRTITVPNLTIAVNRVTDVVSGRGPKGRRLTVEAQHCDVTDACEAEVTRTVTVDRSGRYRKDLSSAVNMAVDTASVVLFDLGW